MIGRVILSIGHGAGDPGAVSGNIVENKEATQITNRLADKLGDASIPFILLPDLSYVESIKKVNEIYKPGDWAIEIHKDSFTYNKETMHRRMGVYHHHASAVGKQVAEMMLKAFVGCGANKFSWVRPDTFSNHGGLGWNTMTKPMAHIIEAGFVQGDNSDSEDEFYAEAIFQGIKAVFAKF